MQGFFRITNVHKSITEMSKHNNNLSPSSSKSCRCGRYISIGEEKAGIGVFNYECPDCIDRRLNPISSEKYYEQFKRMFE